MKKFLTIILCLTFAGYLAGAAQALERTVRVASYAGDVKIVPVGAAKGEACRVGMKLKAGTRVITGEEASVEVTFDKPGRNVLKIKENSEVVIKLEDADRIDLVDGEIITVLRDLKRGETFRVRTPCATCGARGTGWNTKTDKNITNVAVFDGEIFVRGIKKDGSAMDEEYRVKRGFERKIRKFERPAKMEKISEARFSRMEREVERLVKPKGELGEKPARPSVITPRKPEGVAEKKAEVTERREKVTEKRAEMAERKEKVAEKKAEIAERKERVAEKKEKIIEKREKIEKMIEKGAAMREERRESVIERKDDERIDKIGESRINTDG